MLLTYEKSLLAHFILQSKKEQKRILEEAYIEPRTSGPLLIAYSWALANT